MLRLKRRVLRTWGQKEQSFVLRQNVNCEQVFEMISKSHESSWLGERYSQFIKEEIESGEFCDGF